MVKTSIRTVGIAAKPHSPEAAKLLPDITEFLKRRNCTILLDKESAFLLGRAGEGVARGELMKSCDLVIVLGGDGTLLSLARFQGSREVPILGINMGSLGFLTEVYDSEAMDQLQAAFDGRIECSMRMMLQSELVRGDESKPLPHVLNDIVINKSAVARIFDLDVIVNGERISTIRADGLIVSTPTGSTAYNLAAGGPIVHPEMNVFILAPICPHTLTNRPLVLPGDSLVELRINGGEEVYLTLDGQEGFPLVENDLVRVRRGERTLCILSPVGRSYFEVLQNKLKWGER
jgi:NAD+ kinase